MLTFLNDLRRLDRSRPGVPGEHWATFGTGLYYLLRKRRGIVGALASKALGLALVARALGGRDGAIAVLRRPPRARGGRPADRLVDIAAPWPYDERVRIERPSSIGR